MTDDKTRPPDPFPVAFVCDILAFPVVLWTTRLGTWGYRYPGWNALLGVGLWPVLFAALYGPHPRLGFVKLFWLASLVWLLAHRVVGLVRRSRSYQCHSRFWGESLFDRSIDPPGGFRARGLATAAAAAVGLVCFVGQFPPLGALILLSAAAKVVSDVAGYLAVEDRLRQMADARLETEFYVGRFRQRHDR